MTDIKQVLPERLKELRAKYHFTVQETEWISGVSRSALNTWERGTRTASADGLYQIATAFGVSMDWLYGLTTTRYTDDSIAAAESIYVSHSLLKDVLENMVNVYNSSVSLRKKLLEKYYCKENLSLQLRADVLVYCLFLHNFYTVFYVKSCKKEPSAQQLRTRNEVEKSLFLILTTHLVEDGSENDVR